LLLLRRRRLGRILLAFRRRLAVGHQQIVLDAATGDAERKHDRGAFFKSIHATLNHLLSGDGVWLARFNGKTYPTAPPGEALHDDFDQLRAARVAMDEEILSWARAVTPESLAEPMTWTAKLYAFTQTHPRWVQVAQMFNHQTHHRGQVHAMLTAAGVDVGPTDLPVMPILNTAS